MTKFYNKHDYFGNKEFVISKLKASSKNKQFSEETKKLLSKKIKFWWSKNKNSVIAKERNLKISKKLKGRKSQIKDIEKWKYHLSLANKNNLKVIERCSKQQLDKTAMFSDISIQKRSQTHKKLWENKMYRDKRISIILKNSLQRPTSFEQKIYELCLKYNLPFVYSGDGQILIGCKNPDFINEKDKIIIEVFLNYFKERNYGSVENYILKRSEHFAKHGYKTVFIREEEICDEKWEKICLNKIQEIM